MPSPPTLIRDLTVGPAGRLLRDHVWPQLRWLIYAGLCMALYAAATAGQAWIMEPMLDHVFLAHDRLMLLLVPIAVIALAFLKGVSGYGQAVLMARIGQRVIAALQQRLFDHLIHADLGYLVARGPGHVISRLTYDTQQLRHGDHHGPDHRGARFFDHGRPGRADDPSGLAARRPGAARLSARDLADPAPRSAHAQGVPPDPDPHGQAHHPARSDLPRRPPGQGRQPRGRRVGAHRRPDRGAVPPEFQGRARQRHQLADHGGGGRLRGRGGGPLRRRPGAGRRTPRPAPSSRSSRPCCSPTARSRRSPTFTPRSRSAWPRPSGSTPCSTASRRCASSPMPGPWWSIGARSGSPACALATGPTGRRWTGSSW